MDVLRIANILYNMSLDMDYADNTECADDEIAEIARGIESAGNDSLLQCLAIIADNNADLYNCYMNAGDSIAEN